MREIKFRAWTEVGMLTTDEIDNEGFWAHADNHPEWPLMQYTGLKDRLGREVYEGDIIRWGNITGGMHTEKVEYYVGTEGDGYQMAGFVLGCDWQEQFEIIGNIYENPELVPSEKEK